VPQFLRIERLRDYIEAAEIENLSPQEFVGR
jgi:hypothetical protein